MTRLETREALGKAVLSMVGSASDHEMEERAREVLRAAVMEGKVRKK